MNSKRHELACSAHEQLDTASVQQLIDGLSLRLKTISEEQGEIREGAQYVASILMAEIAKRHQLELLIH